MRFWFVILFSIFIGLSCSSGNGGDAPIAEDQMIELLVDMHLTDAILVRGITQGSIKKEITYSVYKSVMTKHNITPELFDSAFNYYSKDLKRFDKMYQDVINRLKEHEEMLSREDSDAAKK